MAALNLTMDGVAFRYATVEDAGFILQLRSTAVARQTLSTGAASLDAQKQWLLFYKEREAQGVEHYFVISYRNEPVGVVRVYGIQPATGGFTWGSWAIQADTPPVVAWITAVLLYDFAFGQLGLGRATFEVVASNHNVIRFHQSFGAVSEGVYGDRMRFNLPRDIYTGIRGKFLRRIQLSGSPRESDQPCP